MTDAIETPMSPETFTCVYSTELKHVNVEFCGTHTDDGYRTDGYPVRRALDVLERLVRARDAAIRADERAKILSAVRDFAGDWDIDRHHTIIEALRDLCDSIESKGGGDG